MADYPGETLQTRVRRIRLKPWHQATDSFRAAEEEGRSRRPAELVIIRYDSMSRHSLQEKLVPRTVYNLIFLDAGGEEMGDWDFPSLWEALLMAEDAYQIKPEEWEVLG